MMRADLHIHTTASDGVFPPEAIVDLALQANLQTIAITDHDTCSGISAAAVLAAQNGIHCIPGVEISAGDEQDIHILGYGISPSSPRLTTFFQNQKAQRRNRIFSMVKKLQNLGIDIQIEDVFSLASGTAGRPHIARALVNAGYAASVQEAFQKYLGRHCAAYVPRDPISPFAAISLLRAEGAVPVLAHPALIKWTPEHLFPMLRAWIADGLMGLEVYHPSQKGQFAYWQSIAKANHLIVTGGSDFHAPNTQNGPIGGTADCWHSAQQDVEQLFTAMHSAYEE